MIPVVLVVSAFAPPPADVARLPPTGAAEAGVVLAEAAVAALDARRRWLIPESHETAALDAVLADARWRRDVWRALRYARWAADALPPTTARERLADLRAVVGPAAYAAGWWPDPLPLVLQTDDSFRSGLRSQP